MSVVFIIISSIDKNNELSYYLYLENVYRTFKNDQTIWTKKKNSWTIESQIQPKVINDFIFLNIVNNAYIFDKNRILVKKTIFLNENYKIKIYLFT